MKAYERIIEILRAEGIDTVFTYQDSDIMHLLNEIREHRHEVIRLVHARHEQSAVGMANGYAQAGGGLGVCILGRGPAIAQTGASLVSARKARSSVLVIATETATDVEHDLKAFEEGAYLRSTIENVVTVRSVETLGATVRDAIRRIRAEEVPYAVRIPRDLLNAEVESEAIPPVRLSRLPVSRSPVDPESGDLQAAVEQYLDSDASRAPIVLAGVGAVQAGARTELEALAERIEAVLVTTLRARGLFGDHPYAPGFVGDRGSPLANEIVLESDYVVAVGASLNDHTLDSGHLLREGATVVQIDDDPAAFGRFRPVDVPIHGEARRSVRALTELIELEGIDRAGAFWTDALRERIASTPTLAPADDTGQPGVIDPRALVRSLDVILPEDRLVVCDGGHIQTWFFDGLRTPGPEQLIWPYHFFAIGQGLPAGVGAAVADPTRTCVTVCGDAGFLMSLQEVETAAREEVPVVVVVGNDEALGAEYHVLSRAGGPADHSILESPDLAATARGLGAEGYTVRSTDDLDGIAEHIDERPTGPVVLDCRIDRSVRHRSIG